ncbi:hypothetical protein PG994_007526 [Apiospora phragmitis]|uniref:Uncharacterized protein n=1 Tax=Apiospora phragmitis TaxID=2905665 RepID=A0ABR1V122_9PEZI
MATTPKKVQFGRDQHIKTTKKSSSPTIGQAVPLTPVYFSKPFSSSNHSPKLDNNSNSDNNNRSGLFLAKIEYYNHDPRERDFFSLEAIDLSSSFCNNNKNNNSTAQTGGGSTQDPRPELTQLPRGEVWEQLALMQNRGYVDCIHVKIIVARRSRELVRYVTTPQTATSSSSTASSPSWRV